MARRFVAVMCLAALFLTGPLRGPATRVIAWEISGGKANTCTGPLMDGQMDFTCSSPRMCVQGSCR
ncbi:MAG TPA: hypothetical protein VFH73_18940 [Polyangia bacterium]|jgi:hypothetical protein|nr:hypothetical protein [Polyangia bacterium]